MASKHIIYTENAPDPIGPYNQAILAGNTLYISGQIAIDPFSGVMVDKSIKEEARQVMANLGAVLKAAGFSFNDVVKCSIFLSEMDHFGVVNTVYGSYFEEGNEPARETVAVKTLPKNVNVEISAIAVKG